MQPIDCKNSSFSIIALLSLFIIGITLSGCELLGPEMGIKLPLDPDVANLGAEPGNDGQEVVYSQLENDGSDDDEDKVEIEEYVGTGKFVSPSDAQKKKSSAEGKYTLNFDDADLREVTKIILSDMLGENYILSPKVGGKVTLQTTRPLTKEELLPTLEMLYQMNGAVLLKETDTYRIEPLGNALQGGSAPELGEIGQNLSPGYQVKIIPLEFVGVKDMTEILTPLVSAKAILRSDPARNLLMVAGNPRELARILETVNTFDVNLLEGMSFGLYPLENIDAVEAIVELENLINKEGEGPLAGMFRFVPIERLNAVMVITHQPKYLREAKKWVSRLDRTDSVKGEGVIVYRAQHVDAIQLSETLNSIFTGTGAEVKRKVSLAPGQTGGSISNKQPREGTKKTTIQVRKRSADASTELSDLSDVRVIADEPNNALIVIARPQQYKVVHKIIKQLDVMPLQVLIDATIVAVQLTGELKYGVQWKFKNSLPGDKTGLGILSTAADGALNSIFPGFSYVVSGGDSVDLILNMLAKKDMINVISSPSIMVLNNQEATIQVGDQVPIRTSESTNTSGSLNPIQTSSIEMRDTGVTLKVTPRVNANGVVLMEIDESVDTAKRTTVSSIDSPTILQRKINSSVAVVSGETIVLGGLISEQHDISREGIPFLHDLPWIGDMFGSTSKTKTKDELIVLITPRVVENKHDARKVSREYKKKMTGIFEDMSEADGSNKGFYGNFSR